MIDPLLSLLICALITLASLRLLKEALHIIMEGVPQHLNLPEVGQALATHEHVLSVHDLHIWTLSSNRIALSAHIVLADIHHWPKVLTDLSHELDHHFHIKHITLQPELQGQEQHVDISALNTHQQDI